MRGFGVLEALIALALLAVGLLALNRAQLAGLQGGQRAREITEALELLEGHMETLRCLRPDDPLLADVNPANNDSLDDPSAFDHQSSGLRADGQPGGIYTLTWNVADDQPWSGFRTVVVMVSWKGHRLSAPMILERP